jgi:hypothetical protein
MPDRTVEFTEVCNVAHPGPTPMSSRRLGRLSLVVALAVVIRISLLAGNIGEHPWSFFQDRESVETEISSTEQPYMNPFGFEASNIAHAWVCGNQGFASPFGGATGPTAWIAPGVVAFYAVAFALWGCFTFTSILFAYSVALCCSIVTTVVVFRIGSRVGRDSRVGFLAALFFACLPFESWVYKISGHLDFNLQVFWFAVLLLQVLRAADSASPRAGVWLGIVTAMAALFNPILIACAAVGVVHAVRRRPRRESIFFVVAFTIACGVVLGPYIVFQSLRLGGFVPVKSNAGFELYLGNTPESRGVLDMVTFETFHPSQNTDEFLTYAEVGELAYVRAARRRFFRDVDLRTFLGYTLRRTYHFFVGYQTKPWDRSPLGVAVKIAMWAVPLVSVVILLAIRRGRLESGEGLVLAYTVMYAAPYLITGVMERYRIPMATTVALVLALLTRDLIGSWHRHRSEKSADDRQPTDRAFNTP